MEIRYLTPQERLQLANIPRGLIKNKQMEIRYLTPQERLQRANIPRGLIKNKQMEIRYLTPQERLQLANIPRGLLKNKQVDPVHTSNKVDSVHRISLFGGPKNGKNNCFINASLQVIFNIPELVDNIVFGKGQHQAVQEAYQQYLGYMENRQAGKFCSAPDLASPLRDIVPEFKGDGQHDAFEFILKVLIDPLKTKTNPLFFACEDRSYYHDYEKHKAEIEEHFEADGGRISKAPETLSSLQLSLPKDASSCKMEDLILSNLHEKIAKKQDGSGVEFKRSDGLDPIRLQLAEKNQKIRIPDAFFVDFKRHAVISQQFNSGGTFQGAKNETPIQFTETFSIPPELDMDGKGATCEWVALVNGGDFKEGHYFANVKKDGNYYRYDDSSMGTIPKQDFIDAGQQCYGGFVRVVKRGDSHPIKPKQASNWSRKILRYILAATAISSVGQKKFGKSDSFS
ncbi:MAG: hypothetical protein QNJ27_02400 [Simkaniaceae bacterium]|nr:hypothetical protein [Simkaniaceae bacterium]